MKNSLIAFAFMLVLLSSSIVAAQETSNPRAPTLEVFVMSYCPYGLQMEKGVIPVYRLLKDNVNFKIRFVSYAMHGEKEEDENARQICIREETGQFWQYLSCFVDKGDSAECIEQAGLNESEINDCMENKASDYMDSDKDLNDKYGVTASPTNVLDGKVIEISPRSPEEVMKAVCAAFENPPEQCDKSIDKTNPSPGFGRGTSGSAAAGGCGDTAPVDSDEEDTKENEENSANENVTEEEAKEEQCGVCPAACNLEKSGDSCGECICPPNYGFCSESGLRDSINGTSVYCYKGLWQTQKENNNSCQNNFECKSNFCSEDSCYDISKQVKESASLIQRILDWISHLFGNI